MAEIGREKRKLHMDIGAFLCPGREAVDSKSVAKLIGSRSNASTCRLDIEAGKISRMITEAPLNRTAHLFDE